MLVNRVIRVDACLQSFVTLIGHALHINTCASCLYHLHVSVTLNCGCILRTADANFVSTTSIQNVSPGETFRRYELPSQGHSCICFAVGHSFTVVCPFSFLGVDAAVRVDYRDFGPKTSRSGMFSKSSVTTHKFATTIRYVVL